MREDRCRAVAGPLQTIVNKLAIRDDRHAERQPQLYPDPAEDGEPLPAAHACDGSAGEQPTEPGEEGGVDSPTTVLLAVLRAVSRVGR